MTTPQDLSLPTPTIIIAVGSSAMEAVRQVRNIYLRSDTRRATATNFLALQWDDDHICLLPLHDALEKSAQQEKDVAEEEKLSPDRRHFFHDMVLNSQKVTNRLEADLFEIRTHGALIQSGWEDQYDIPVSIYLVADVKEPIAAGAALPMLCMLQSIADNTHLCDVHALFDIGVFPLHPRKSARGQDLDVYTFLIELDHLLTDSSENRENLSRLLGLECCGFDKTTIYLFDSRKEGTYVVKDERQMHVMVGNALLSLLQNDFARQVSIRHDRFEIADHKSFYHSIGSTMIGYDPASFQDACAKRISKEFVENFLLAQVVDEQMAAQEAGKLVDEFGSLHDWFQHSFYNLPPVIGKVQIDQKTTMLSITLADLRVKDLDYENIRQTPWPQQFREYDLHFLEASFPTITSAIDANTQKMAELFKDFLASLIDVLPTKPDFYPGGVQNSIACLDSIDEYLTHQKQTAFALTSELGKANAGVEDRIKKNLERIEEIFNRAPNLPWLVRIMPRFIRAWVAPFYYARRYGKKLYEAIHLKEKVISLLQGKAAGLAQNEALQRIDHTLSELRELTAAGKLDYQALHEKIQAALIQLPDDWPEFPFGNSENGWDSLFRIPVVDHQVARWGYERFRPSLNKWGSFLLDDTNLFLNWRDITPQLINEALYAAGSLEYQPLWSLSLEDIFSLREEWRRTEISESIEVSRLIETSCHSAVPLIRPDYDAAGGSAISSLSSHALVGRPEWRTFKVPERLAASLNIDVLYTGDQYTCLFTRLRHCVPLISLEDLIRQGKHRYQNLSTQDRLDLRIVPSSKEIIAPLPGGAQKDPDLECVTFDWEFKPKGSASEFQQQLMIMISRKRFEYYRRLPRLGDGWNKYAEEEMPEVRALATEFQRLHSHHNWNTFNQVSNVLKFVQTCVRYSYDKDTTGHAEWPRYPIETIMEGTGDCEDVAILCAAILARLGFQVVLLSYPGHMAFGVAGAEKLKGEYIRVAETGRRYFYGEATSEGWHLGQIPQSYRNTAPEIMPVNILVDEEETQHS